MTKKSKLVRRVAKTHSTDLRVYTDEYNGNDFIAVSEWWLKNKEVGWLPRRGRQVTVRMKPEFVRQVVLGLAEAVRDDELVELIEPLVRNEEQLASAKTRRVGKKIKQSEDGNELVSILDEYLDSPK